MESAEFCDLEESILVMTKPLVSVIITCFNHKDYVDEALRSVITQEYNNVEIFLIDDASTDGSIEVVLSLKEEYPHINLILNQQNMGVLQNACTFL